MTTANPTQTPSCTWIVNLAVWLHDHWPRLASLAGSIGFASVGVWFSVKGKDASVYAWLTFALSVCSFFVGEVVGWKRATRISSLENAFRQSEETRRGLEQILEQSSQDYFDLLREQLSILANDVFEFSDRERISVYKHDGVSFVMLGRYSKNPKYNKKGRAIYPDNEGCIAKAWNEGLAVIENLPDPSIDLSTYSRDQKQDWRLPIQVSKAFNMKSRSYVALALDDLVERKRIAVAVFESIAPTGALDSAKINDLIRSHEGKRIAQFLERMTSLEPSPTFAREKGY